jgi:hypothetical protein
VPFAGIPVLPPQSPVEAPVEAPSARIVIMVKTIS